MGESPSASQSSFCTSAEARAPRRSAGEAAGSSGGRPLSERVEGTQTWSCVMCAVLAWCLAWLAGIRTSGARDGTKDVRDAPRVVRDAEARLISLSNIKMNKRKAYAECKIHPTVLLISFDSEYAWCPASCPEQLSVKIE
jgi:hypothetical protein